MFQWFKAFLGKFNLCKCPESLEGEGEGEGGGPSVSCQQYIANCDTTIKNCNDHEEYYCQLLCTECQNSINGATEDEK